MWWTCCGPSPQTLKPQNYITFSNRQLRLCRKICAKKACRGEFAAISFCCGFGTGLVQNFSIDFKSGKKNLCDKIHTCNLWCRFLSSKWKLHHSIGEKRRSSILSYLGCMKESSAFKMSRYMWMQMKVSQLIALVSRSFFMLFFSFLFFMCAQILLMPVSAVYI